MLRLRRWRRFVAKLTNFTWSILQWNNNLSWNHFTISLPIAPHSIAVIYPHYLCRHVSPSFHYFVSFPSPIVFWVLLPKTYDSLMIVRWHAVHLQELTRRRDTRTWRDVSFICLLIYHWTVSHCTGSKHALVRYCGNAEIAGLDIAGRLRRGGHCRTGEWRTGHWRTGQWRTGHWRTGQWRTNVWVGNRT